MTSSGTYNYALSNGEAILAAFDRIGLSATEIKQRHMATARREINLVFSRWSNLTVNLWTVELLSVPLVEGTATYTLPARVTMMLDAYRSTTGSDGTQIDNFMSPMTRDMYAAYPNKSQPGPPTMFWFNRQITPEVTLFPVPDGDGPYTLNYYACTQIQDANVPGGETPNIPYRWYDAFVAELAYRMSRSYAHELEAARKEEAKEAWDVAAAQDIENAPLTVFPSIGVYYG